MYRNSLTGDASFNYIAMTWNCINLWRRGYNWTKSREDYTGKQAGYIILCSTNWVRLIYSLHLIILLFKTYCEKSIQAQSGTVYPKKYAHGFCFAVLCCGYTLTDFPISIRLTSLALWQSSDCPSASKATLMNMDKYFMWIHYERLHNHNKAKHNKTVCIFLGIYCTAPYLSTIFKFHVVFTIRCETPRIHVPLDNKMPGDLCIWRYPWYFLSQVGRMVWVW